MMKNLSKVNVLLKLYVRISDHSLYFMLKHTRTCTFLARMQNGE